MDNNLFLQQISYLLNKEESFNQLTALLQNQKPLFLEFIFPILHKLNLHIAKPHSRTPLKVQSLKLLIYILKNIKPQIQHVLNFQELVKNLADQKQQIRQQTHFLMKTYCNRYNDCNILMKAYLVTLTDSQASWKLNQKCIHSLQGLIEQQPTCLLRQKIQSLNGIVQKLLQKVQSTNLSIHKASYNAVSSLSKSKKINQIMPKLKQPLKNKLILHAQQNNIVLLYTNQEQKSRSKNNKNSQSYFEKQSIQLQRHSNYKKDQQKPKVQRHSSYNVRLQQLSVQEHYINKNVKTPIDVQRRSQQKNRLYKKNQNNLVHQKNQIVELLEEMQPQLSWQVRCQKIQILQKLLTPLPEYLPNILFQKLLILICDSNFKISLTSLNILQNLIRIDRTPKEFQHNIIGIVVQKLGQTRHSIRQVAFKIMSLKFNQKRWFQKLYESARKGNNMIKEQFINLILGAEKILFLDLVLTFLASLVQEQKTSLKIKSRDCLAAITIKNNMQYCKEILSTKMKNIYYEMFLQRLNTACKQKKLTQQINKSKSKEKLQSILSQKVQAKKSSKVQVKQFPHAMFQKTATQCGTKMVDTQTTFNPLNTFQNLHAGMKTYDASYNMFEQTSMSSHSCKHPNLKNKQERKKVLTPFQIKPIQDRWSMKQKNTLRKVVSQQKQSVSNQQQIEFKIRQNEYVQQKKQQKNYYKPPMIKKSMKRRDQEQQSYKVQQQKKQQKQQPLIIYSLTKKSEEYKDQRKIIKPKSINRKPLPDIQEKEEVKQITKPFKPPFNKKVSFTYQKSMDAPFPDYKPTLYVTYSQLTPFDYPQNKFKQIMVQIRTQDWSRQYEAMNMLRRLCKYHPNELQKNNAVFPQLVGLVFRYNQIIKLIQSLRSNLSKNSMITINQLVDQNKKVLQLQAESIYQKLFKKVLDTNTFISEQAKKCLVAVTSSFSVARTTSILLNHSQSKVQFINKSTQVKLHVMICVQKIVQKSVSKFFNLKDANQLIKVMGNYISDASNDIRNATKKVFLQMNVQQGKKSQFDQFLKRNLNDQQYGKIRNILAEKESKNKLIIKNSKNYDDNF